jgi:hypothetical protein
MNSVVWAGYLWLLIGSLILLVRCLLDVGRSPKRPFSGNLSYEGMLWLGGVLLLVLSLRAFIPSLEPSPLPGQSAILERAASAVVRAAEQINQNLPQHDLRSRARECLAVLCQLLVVGGLIATGAWHFQRLSLGISAAVLYLILPYTAAQAKDLNQVVPAALLVTLIFCYRWPTFAGLLLGFASALVFFPVMLVPVWFTFYLWRGAGRFLVAVALALVLVGVLLWADDWYFRAAGDASARAELEATFWRPDWRAWDLSAKPGEEGGFWAGWEVHYAYRMLPFIAYLSLIILAAIWPTQKNLGQLLALSAALIIGVQFWYAREGGVYVLWYLPFLILMVMRPRLDTHLALPIQPKKDWLTNTLARLGMRRTE